jgi:hypothetical protein
MNFTFILTLFLLTNLIFPQQSSLSKGVNYLSDFIASEQFLELKNQNNDLALVDSIYSRAIQFYDYDYQEALLTLTFTTIPYSKVPLVVPIIKSRIFYPLISANDSISTLKNKNLPKKLFYDTPSDIGGDKDKLAHFFGNAYIGYAENILNLADVFGYFVEVFEEDFKSQSKIDFRDMDVNWYGVLFGELLETHKNVLPSQIMTLRSLRYFLITL